MIPFLWNVFITLRSGEPAGDDPWEGNTLEWATSSPPPPYNFDRLPEIRSERPLFDARHGRTAVARMATTPTLRPAAADDRRPSTTRSPARPRHRGGISNPILGMILFICSRGDVLRRAVRRLLQRPGDVPGLAARRLRRPSSTELPTARRSIADRGRSA